MLCPNVLFCIFEYSKLTFFIYVGTIMTINFYPKRDGKDNIRLVMVYLREKGKTFQYSSNIKIDINKWDNNKQRVKRAHHKAMVINSAFDKLKLNMEEIHNKYISDNPFGTLIQFKEYFKQKMKDKVTRVEKGEEDTFILPIFQKYIEIKKHQHKENTIKKYITLKNLLEEYQTHIRKTIKFSDINYSFYEKFYEYNVNNRQLANNTISKYFDFFSTFLKWCKEMNYSDIEHIIKYKIKTTDTLAVALTKEELFQLYNYNFKKKSLDRVRDVFCFACFTGARYSDIEHISREELSDSHRKFRSPKTGTVISVPLQDEAKEIIKKYKENIRPLPVISSQKTNDYLKEACKEAGINTDSTKETYIGQEPTKKLLPKYELISFHTARRTFATLSMNKNINHLAIMKITGHSNLNTFMKYVKTTTDFIDAELSGSWF